MHMAAKNGHYLVVKYLLERGADCQITNLEEQTPKDLLLKSVSQQAIKIKKLSKKQKIDPKEQQDAHDKYKSMQDTLEMLADSEQAMGGQRVA